MVAVSIRPASRCGKAWGYVAQEIGGSGTAPRYRFGSAGRRRVQVPAGLAPSRDTRHERTLLALGRGGPGRVLRPWTARGPLRRSAALTRWTPPARALGHAARAGGRDRLDRPARRRVVGRARRVFGDTRAAGARLARAERSWAARRAPGHA